MDKMVEFRNAVRNIVGTDALVEAVAGICSACLEAADGKGNDYETLRDMALWLISESNVLNMCHWNVTKSNKHELLQEAYELCRDTGDKMAETYIALSGSPCVGKPTIDLDKMESFSDEKVLPLLKNLQSHMQDALAKNDKFSEGVKNIFADFDEKMTSIIYKYQQFES